MLMTMSARSICSGNQQCGLCMITLTTERRPQIIQSVCFNHRFLDCLKMIFIVFYVYIFDIHTFSLVVLSSRFDFLPFESYRHTRHS